jgi:hypothetical protein
MTDLQTLLSTAALSDSSAYASAAVADADVLRGHRALARRKLKQRAGRSALLGAVVVAGVGVVQLQHGSSAPATRATPSTQQAASATALVAYTGKQPAGFTVDAVPAGWTIQSVNTYALTIARVGATDLDPSSYASKLVVMLKSKAVPIPTAGTPVAVGTGRGVISYFDPSAAQLFFKDSTGRVLDIQVPPSLHWSAAQIGQFGASVHANSGAATTAG